MNKYFYEVFENIPRQGPGLNSYTSKAYKQIEPDLPAKPEILDIGCGKGVQTLQLAQISSGYITATDNRQFFLDTLQSDAEKAGLGERIITKNADMAKLTFKKQFDLIWAEGSVFIIGIKEGFKQWKTFIKEGGFLVLTDLLWFGEDRPEEITKYLEEECMYVLTVKEAIKEAEKNDYECINHFTLPHEGWTTAYLEPQRKVINQLRKKYAGNKEAIETFDALEYEREMINKYHKYFGYEFLILRRK